MLKVFAHICLSRALRALRQSRQSQYHFTYITHYIKKLMRSMYTSVCVCLHVSASCKPKPFNYSHVFIIHNDKSLSISVLTRCILCEFSVNLRIFLKTKQKNTQQFIEINKNKNYLYECSVFSFNATCICKRPYGLYTIIFYTMHFWTYK